jgi:hypothetical protein
LPAVIAGAIIAVSAVTLVTAGTWAAVCPDCYPEDYRYSEPPTREFTFFWSFLSVSVLVAAYLCALVLFTYAARFAIPTSESLAGQATAES